MNFTKFLGLKKPLVNEKYNITIVNENNDKIDSELNRINESLNNETRKTDGHISDNNVHISLEDKAKLNSIENGAQVNTISGVKGNNETDYRRGNINLTPEHIGADVSGSANTALLNAKKYADDNKVDKTMIGTTNGVAALNETRKILSENIPFGDGIDEVMNGKEGVQLKNKLTQLETENDSHIKNENIHFTSDEREKLNTIELNANNYKHPSSEIEPGSYKIVTVDDDGHVTSGSNPTTIDGFGITDAETKGTAISTVSEHNLSSLSHQDIRILIDDLTNRFNALADSDDETLDQMSEIVTYIKSNKELIESITTSKVNITDIVNNLTTNVSDKPLSAAQGIMLKNLIDTLQKELDDHLEETDGSLISHINDTSIHITPAERTNWNDTNAKKHMHSNKTVLDGISSTLISAWNNVTNKLDKTGDASNVTNTITAASVRENLKTGEKLSASLGKISKWFSDLKTIAFTGSYNDLTNKPTIPTVGDGTITINQNGTTKGTFSMNQSENITIELTDTNTDTDTTYNEVTYSKSGLMSAIDKKRIDSFTGIYIGDMAGKTIVDLQNNFSTWLSSYCGIANASCTFVAHSNWITLWNNKNTTDAIPAGVLWTVRVIGEYSLSTYVQLEISTYISDAVYYVVLSNGTWQNVKTAAFLDSFSTGNSTKSGLTKLYTSTGTNTDGSMTQSAIKSALDLKMSKNAFTISNGILTINLD